AQPAPAPIAYADDEEGDDEGDYDADASPLATQPQLPVVAPALEDEGTFTGTGSVPDALARQALDILRTMLGYMNMPAAVTISRADPFTLNIHANGNDEMMRLFIGRRGETLAAVQLIVNMMLNHQGRDRYHIVVDIDHYRARRDDNLRSLALRVAQQVQGSQRPITLEPMTPYERRLVHMTLQELPYVQTQSTGEGDARRVVVSPKRASR
ncbi:MAG: KH domain-containing protein, partial [Ktedonobacterales bacterium]|nr:KH domain-containing protein [Ktedonobacterales bacterium]